MYVFFTSLLFFGLLIYYFQHILLLLISYIKIVFICFLGNCFSHYHTCVSITTNVYITFVIQSVNYKYLLTHFKLVQKFN